MSKLLDELRAREAAKKAAVLVAEPVKEDPAAAAKVITDGIDARVLQAYHAGKAFLDVMELPRGDIDFSRSSCWETILDGDSAKAGTVVALVNVWCKAEGYDRTILLRGPACLELNEHHQWWLRISGWGV